MTRAKRRKMNGWHKRYGGNWTSDEERQRKLNHQREQERLIREQLGTRKR